ncbi:MAG: glycosyltransferase family 1 protein [Alphaproteobacteria bacterium]|nr:glycosyltransferase family 1 protein [Alphaproteobacteria bacterium]
MRVLYISPTGGVGLSSAAPINFARETARRGHTVGMLGMGVADEVRTFADAFPLGDSWRRLGARLQGIRSVVRRFAPEIVHVFWHPKCEAYPVAHGRRGRTVWLADGRALVVREGLLGSAYRLSARLAPMTYDALAAISEPIGARLFGRPGLPALPLGFDSDIFFPAASAQPAGGGDLSLVYSGSLNARRFIGPWFQAIVDAGRALPPGATRRPMLHVFGQGDGEASVRALAAQAPDLMRVHGFVTRVVLADHLRRADVGLSLIVNPLSSLAPPLKTIEYLATGLPVIASDMPGNRIYVREGWNGWLIGSDPADLRALVTQLCVTGVGDTMSRQAADSVRGHTWGAIVEERLLPFYRACLERRR